MKILKTILKIIYNLLFVVLAISATFVILTTYNIIKGYNFYVVMSGSMEPAIHTGSVVMIQEQDTYDIDDVVTAKMTNNPNETYTHRIIEKSEIEDGNTYKTKGDANETEDPDIINEDQIIGKKKLSIPLVGYPVSFAKTSTGFIVMIIVPAIIIVSSEINNIRELAKGEIEKRNNLKKEKGEKEIK